MNVPSYQWLLIVVTKILYFVDANWITGNLCWSMPCMNGGSCFGSAYTYLCVCPINYSGSLCEKRLGICQESPCGNRGLCIETGLTSFECRCYFDYMGPLCEEHVPKNDPSLWSSLIPVHTRVLFDILQHAYRSKAQGRSVIDSYTGQIDFVGLLTTDGTSSSFTTTSSTILDSTFITHQTETTGSEHVIRAEDIQLEKIFPGISTVSTSDTYTQSFTSQTSEIYETTQQNEYNNETKFSTYLETDITSTMMTTITENITNMSTPLMTVENVTTMPLEQNQTNPLNITEVEESFNITEQVNTTITSPSIEWSSYNSDNNTIGYTTEITENLTEQINNNTESEEFIMNTTQTIDYTSSETTTYLPIQSDEKQFNSSEQIMTSTLTITDQSLTTETSNDTFNISQNTHNQLLYKLCQQLLSHILPNVSSLSSTSAIESALSLASGSSPTSNNSTDALLTWIKNQLSLSTTTITTTTITTTTITTTPSTLSLSSSSSSSSSSSLLITGKQLSSIPLQRVDMDDALYQMNNNIDVEH